MQAADKQAGFFTGIWHGLICPLSWIASWFWDSINIYEVYNTGTGYNNGFMFGLICWILFFAAILN